MDEAQFGVGGGDVTVYRYIAVHVQAGFYSDVVECLLSMRENMVRSPSGKKGFFFACYNQMVSNTLNVGRKKNINRNIPDFSDNIFANRKEPKRKYYLHCG